MEILSQKTHLSPKLSSRRYKHYVFICLSQHLLSFMMCIFAKEENKLNDILSSKGQVSFILENGRMESLQVQAKTITRMEACMKEDFKMGYLMDMEDLSCLMETIIKDKSNLEEQMEQEHIKQINLSIKDLSKII